MRVIGPPREAKEGGTHPITIPPIPQLSWGSLDPFARQAMGARTTLLLPRTLMMPPKDGVKLSWGSLDPLARQETRWRLPLQPPPVF